MVIKQNTKALKKAKQNLVKQIPNNETGLTHNPLTEPWIFMSSS